MFYRWILLSLVGLAGLTQAAPLTLEEAAQSELKPTPLIAP